jgi:hypothetical protein
MIDITEKTKPRICFLRKKNKNNSCHLQEIQLLSFSFNKEHQQTNQLPI